MGSQWKVINSNYKNMDGYKRVAWPPVSEERIVREFTPQPQASASLLQGSEPQVAIYNNVKTKSLAKQKQEQQQQKQQQQQQQQNYYQQQQHLQEEQYHQQHHLQQQPHHDFNNPPKTKFTQDINCCTESYHQQQQHQQPPITQPSQNNRYATPTRILHENSIRTTPPISHLEQQQQYYYEQQQQQRAASCEHQQQIYLDSSVNNVSGGWKPIRRPLAKHQKQYQTQASFGLASSSSSSNPMVQQQYRSSSYDNYQVQQNPQQPQNSAEIPTSVTYNQHQPAYQQTPYQSAVPVRQEPQHQAEWTQPQEQAGAPINCQQQLPPYQQQPAVYNQQPVYSQQYQSQLHQQKPPRQYPLSKENQTNKVPYNSNSQFQQHNQPRATSISQDQLDNQAKNKAQYLPQDYRGGSPGIIALRKEAPVSQLPPAVYSSQPAAIGLQGGSNMRGDLKWPPSEYKEAAQRENEERRKLALGPVCRPRKVHRDFTSFFAKNALNSHYPSYKVPPGTQHMLA